MSRTVSVIIPAYNAAATVARTIDSALAQTHEPIEIIVVDDGSKDDTTAVVETFGPPVKLVRKPNGGPASARNLGARLATGEWLAMLDADDWWLPAKLERQFARLDAAGDGEDVGMIFAFEQEAEDLGPEELDFDTLWRRNNIMASTVLIRRATFEELGGFDEARPLVSVEDHHLWLRVAASRWRILACRERLAHYTRGSGISANLDRFLAASLYNVGTIAELLNLPPERLRNKRRDLLEVFGRTALHQRRIKLARQLFARSIAERTTVSNTLCLAAAFVPAPVLDVRRRATEAFETWSHRQGSAGNGLVQGQQVHTAQLDGPPTLLVVIDTEEEFDWSVVPSNSTGITAMRHQAPAQRLMQRYGVVPTYAVDYPIASQHEACAPLLEFLADGTCEIGTQLHPWLSPPIEEELTVGNSYPGNLPPVLEAEKIRVLTRAIEDNLGCRPILYRAGRYGLGRNTARTIAALGYRVDSSVRPLFDMRADGGPDYRHAPTQPFWFGPDRSLLELQQTVGMIGAAARLGRGAYPGMAGPAGRALHVPGILARTGLLNRVTLTPEGTKLAEAKQLTRILHARDGQRVFVLTYHSPSLQPGNTPYVRTDRDLEEFLAWMDGYFDFFMRELGGVPGTPAQMLARASPAAAAAPRREMATQG
jgi:glycosyltransferase involved in cell wall biosynthesis